MMAIGKNCEHCDCSLCVKINRFHLLWGTPTMLFCVTDCKGDKGIGNCPDRNKAEVQP